MILVHLINISIFFCFFLRLSLFHSHLSSYNFVHFIFGNEKCWRGTSPPLDYENVMWEDHLEGLWEFIQIFFCFFCCIPFLINFFYLAWYIASIFPSIFFRVEDFFECLRILKNRMMIIYFFRSSYCILALSNSRFNYKILHGWENCSIMNMNRVPISSLIYNWHVCLSRQQKYIFVLSKNSAYCWSILLTGLTTLHPLLHNVHCTWNWRWFFFLSCWFSQAWKRILNFSKCIFNRSSFLVYVNHFLIYKYVALIVISLDQWQMSPLFIMSSLHTYFTNRLRVAAFIFERPLTTYRAVCASF